MCKSNGSRRCLGNRPLRSYRKNNYRSCRESSMFKTWDRRYGACWDLVHKTTWRALKHFMIHFTFFFLGILIEIMTWVLLFSYISSKQFIWIIFKNIEDLKMNDVWKYTCFLVNDIHVNLFSHVSNVLMRCPFSSLSLF